MKKLLKSKLFFSLIIIIFSDLTIILLTSYVLDGAKYKNKNPTIYTSPEHYTYEYYHSYIFKDFTFQSITTYYDPLKSEQITNKYTDTLIFENGKLSEPNLTRKSVFCLVDENGEKFICNVAIFLQVFYGIMIVISSVWLIALFGLDHENKKLNQLKKDDK